MKRFQITYTNGHVEVIEADGCWPNDWSVAFVREERRQFKAWGAKDGDTVSKFHSFRVIAGRHISEVREVVQ